MSDDGPLPSRPLPPRGDGAQRQGGSVSEDAFLSRWSRRKQQAKSGEPVAEQPPAVDAPPPVVEHDQKPPATGVAAEAPPTAPALPTLDDVAALTGDADFARFVQPGVDDTVKRAAMKKLFADPHFNVMDGLDVYIDDYGKPDPIPPSMLRQMAQSKFLGLFDDEEDDRPAEQDAKRPAASSDGAVAPDGPPPRLEAHEDPDLQLQPDDAAGREGVDGGAGSEPRRVG